MAILARGKVSERPMALVFGSLARRAFTGELTVDVGGRQYVVGWQDGAVVAAHSPHPADGAIKLAITLGMITSTQAGEIQQALAAAPGQDEVEVIRAIAHLADDVVARLGRRMVGARAARALAPMEGELTVTDQPPRGAAIVPIDARWILFTGIRHHFTLERLAWEVTGLASVIRLRHDYDLTGFGFGAAEEEVLARLQEGEVTIAPVPPGLDPQVVHGVALALIATGEAEIVRGPTATRAPRPVETTTQIGVTRSPAPGGHATSAAHAAATQRVASPSMSPPMVSRTATPPPMRTPPMQTAVHAPLRPPPVMVSRTATPMSGFTPTGTPTHVAGHPPTPVPDRAQVSGPVPTAPITGDHPPSVPRTTTGPVPSRTTTGPVPSRTTTGPQAPRTTTGPHGAPGMTGPVPSRTITGPLPSVTGAIPTRTGPIPRKRNPLADDAPAIRELIAERVALLEGEADHYAMLGVERSADANGIRAAYFELARLLHPDRLAALGIADDDRAAQRVFARINDAFTVLSTVARRHEYDALLDAGGAKAVAEREAVVSAQVQAAVEAEERFRLGEMAMRRQQAEIAVHEFQRAVELKPDEPDYLALLGWALYVAARDKVAAVTVARAHLMKAVQMAKETALPFLYLGRIARMEGEDDEAARAFRRALTIAPSNSEAQAELRVVEARRRARPPQRGGLFSKLGKKP